MPFDRSAHRAQAARIVAHGAGEDVLLKWHGKGEAFPASLQAEKPTAARAVAADGPQRFLLTIAIEARGVETNGLMFAGERPRQQQHFTDPAGRLLRLVEDLSVPHAATFLFVCTAADPLSP